MMNQTKINRGYADGKSVRAEKAELKGLRTARDAYFAAVEALRAVDEQKADELERVKNAWGITAVLPLIEQYLLERVEWHHTGDSFEKTNYYRVIENLSSVKWSEWSYYLNQAAEDAAEAIADKAQRLLRANGERTAVSVTPGAYQVLRVDQSRIRLCALVLDERGVKHLLPVFWRSNKTLKTGDVVTVSGDPEKSRLIKSKGVETMRINLYLASAISRAWGEGRRSQDRYQACCHAAQKAWEEAQAETGASPWGFLEVSRGVEALDKAFERRFVLELERLESENA